MPDSNLKSKLNDALLHRINTQIETIQKSIQSIQDSKENETKSSVGDKYETGRAMLHLEQDKLEAQLSNGYFSKTKLETLKSIATLDKVGSGSLVFTNKSTYYLAIGIGKVLLENDTYLVVSPSAPIGKLLVGKSVGDSITFNGNRIEILDIV